MIRKHLKDGEHKAKMRRWVKVNVCLVVTEERGAELVMNDVLGGGEGEEGDDEDDEDDGVCYFLFVCNFCRGRAPCLILH